jgi:predicted DNA binding CopG/RHH family protein
MIDMKYDKESILDAYENGQLKLKTLSKKEIESIKAAAYSMFKKDERIAIHLHSHDQAIKQKVDRKT